MWHSSPLHLSSLPFPPFFSSPPPPSDIYFFHLLNFSSLTSLADSLSLCEGRSVYWSPRFTFFCSATLLEKRSSPSQCVHRYQGRGRRVIALLGAAHGQPSQGRCVIALLGAVLASGVRGPLVGWAEVRVRSASSQRGGASQYEDGTAMPSPAPRLPASLPWPYPPAHRALEVVMWKWLRSAIYCEAESALRHLNGSWHAFLWIYESFFGLLLLQCTAGLGRPLAWGCVGSVPGDQWPCLLVGIADGLLLPAIPDADALRHLTF